MKYKERCDEAERRCAYQYFHLEVALCIFLKNKTFFLLIWGGVLPSSRRVAIQKSKICSRDPVCEDIDPLQHIAESKTQQLNGASCHSGCFVAETTCAFFNQFLDRWVINNENAGFFKDILDE